MKNCSFSHDDICGSTSINCRHYDVILVKVTFFNKISPEQRSITLLQSYEIFNSFLDKEVTVI